MQDQRAVTKEGGTLRIRRQEEIGILDLKRLIGHDEDGTVLSTQIAHLARLRSAGVAGWLVAATVRIQVAAGHVAVLCVCVDGKFANVEFCVISNSSWVSFRRHTVCAIIIRQTPEISMDLDTDTARRCPRSNPASDGGVGLLEEGRLVHGALGVVEDDRRRVEVFGVHTGDAQSESQREDETQERGGPHLADGELTCCSSLIGW